MRKPRRSGRTSQCEAWTQPKPCTPYVTAVATNGLGCPISMAADRFACGEMGMQHPHLSSSKSVLMLFEDMWYSPCAPTLAGCEQICNAAEAAHVPQGVSRMEHVQLAHSTRPTRNGEPKRAAGGKYVWMLQRMTSTAPTRPVRNCQVSSRIANDDNSVGLGAVAQNLLSAKPIIDLVKKIAKLTLFLPETVPLATEEDDIPHRIFELEGEDGTVTSTFNHRVDILNLGMDCVVKYLESIHWESAKIPLDLAQGKLARIADELDYLCGGDREPTKPAGKIADPRPSFAKDPGYEKKMDVFFVASTTTTAQKKSKLKSTN
ncbi:hypothetical protein B0H10DRAFT_1937661 [Mycena sp. CBHHK59/15]|nr:hypothetical protein B0H10DRAFT_1937661 [Mycena sp. CBHHK59/15]